MVAAAAIAAVARALVSGSRGLLMLTSRCS